MINNELLEEIRKEFNYTGLTVNENVIIDFYIPQSQRFKTGTKIIIANPFGTICKEWYIVKYIDQFGGDNFLDTKIDSVWTEIKVRNRDKSKYQYTNKGECLSIKLFNEAKREMGKKSNFFDIMKLGLEKHYLKSVVI